MSILGVIPQVSSTLFFEIESPIGLELAMQARLAASGPQEFTWICLSKGWINKYIPPHLALLCGFWGSKSSSALQGILKSNTRQSATHKDCYNIIPKSQSCDLGSILLCQAMFEYPTLDSCWEMPEVLQQRGSLKWPFTKEQEMSHTATEAD